MFLYCDNSSNVLKSSPSPRLIVLHIALAALLVLLGEAWLLSCAIYMGGFYMESIAYRRREYLGVWATERVALRRR
jgi:hypothetical protein